MRRRVRSETRANPPNPDRETQESSVKGPRSSVVKNEVGTPKRGFFRKVMRAVRQPRSVIKKSPLNPHEGAPASHSIPRPESSLKFGRKGESARVDGGRGEGKKSIPSPRTSGGSLKRTEGLQFARLWGQVVHATDDSRAIRILAEILVQKEGRAFISRLGRDEAELCIEVLGRVSRNLYLLPHFAV